MAYQLGATRIDVLRDVDLRIQAGERVAIAGPSGSDKTSLLLLLSGLEQPVSGNIRVAGTDLSRLDANGRADLRRMAIGIVFQSFHLLPSLSALDNVALPLQLADQPDAHSRFLSAGQVADLQVGSDSGMGNNFRKNQEILICSPHCSPRQLDLQ